jgi:catalase
MNKRPEALKRASLGADGLLCLVGAIPAKPWSTALRAATLASGKRHATRPNWLTPTAVRPYTVVSCPRQQEEPAMLANTLYKHEQYKFGSQAAEEAEFRQHIVRVQFAQQELSQRHAPPVNRRVFHTKSHGCLMGTLTLRPDRPALVCEGLFANVGKQRYNVLARFSNGVGEVRHDLKPDVRGIALKIFGVQEVDSDTGSVTESCVDWLMTNSTNPFGRDQQEFVEFMEANLHPLTKLPVFLLEHPRVAALLLKATSVPVASLATQQYWSGHPYLLGPDRAMKFNVTPVAGVAAGSVTEILGADHLREDLLRRLQDGPVRFSLNVQLEISPEVTPIEDALIGWEESQSPSMAVADLELTRELAGVDADALRFTPAHFIAAHRPLGNLARGRIFTYRASQEGRGALPLDPPEQSLFPE